jgi:hypothetical protein
MHRRTWTAAVLLTCVVALMSTGGGVAVASGSSRSEEPVGPRVPKEGGSVDFTAYSDNDGSKSTAVLTGAIGDFGEAIRTSSGGSTDKEYDELQLSLTHGSFRLDIANLEGRLSHAIYGRFPTYAATCSGEVTVSGATPVRVGSGTGAYKGIRGEFSLTITINEVEKPPTCPKTDTSPYLAQSVFISGSGRVTLP